jgi:hypothetical protein
LGGTELGQSTSIEFAPWEVAVRSEGGWLIESRPAHPADTLKRLEIATAQGAHGDERSTSKAERWLSMGILPFEPHQGVVDMSSA